MADRTPFEYAVLRVVPRVERGESMNAGIIVYCREQGFLGSLVELDESRVRALDPNVRYDEVRRALEAAAECILGPDDDEGRRFRWLTAPRSTVVQPGPVHTGITADARESLRHLFATLVLPMGSSGTPR